MKELFFFIGTEAELIKIFPVYVECQNRGCACHVIASGQNDISKSRILKEFPINGRFVELSHEDEIKKTSFGLLLWFLKTKNIAYKMIRSSFSNDELIGKNLIVHGDTVSTFMGALIGKKLHMKVCHVEAGLRSHNLLNPFPEEIDRLLTSQIARVHFAPGAEAEKNLNRAKGLVVNTIENTLKDSLRLSKTMELKSDAVREILDSKNKENEGFFVFVIHRQENLVNTNLVNGAIENVIEASEKLKCVIILHMITELTFEKLGLMEKLKMNKNIILLHRVDYFDFMKLLSAARFVITDGGSNQEELYYMKKPCLIMRKTTERTEGIGKNARLFDGTAEDIKRFIDADSNYKFSVEEEKANHSSEKIVDVLMCDER